MVLLTLDRVAVGFGGPWLLDHVDLRVEERERIALVGRNGAGKSTLLKVIDGSLEPDEGRATRRTGLRVARLPQALPRNLDGTVRELVSRDLPSAARAIEAAISRVELDPQAEAASLSAGQARRALLARALAHEPDLLLLDEPTNHLDVESIEWVERFLVRLGTALLFVTHDRAFLRRLATRILDLDRGRLTSHEADYDAYRERKDQELDTESKHQSLFDKKLSQEEGWIRQGVRERRKRNQGRVRRLESMRGVRGERRERAGAVNLEAQTAERSGRIVARAKGLTFSWGDKRIVRDFETEISRGDRIGVLGPNGSGKTTLIRLLLGELEPDAGTIRLGANLEIAYFDQRHAQLDDRKTAIENVCDEGVFVTVNGRKRHAIGYLTDFLFTPDQARSPVRDFSGGERNRLLLARMLARPSNVLVMDEPTNDLDLETLERLEVMLLDYPGTVLLVSHDREFMDSIVSSTLVLEGDGRVREAAGGYSDWKRLRDAERPKGEPEKKAERPRKTARPAPSLTRDERKELNGLPKRIETLEADRESLHEAMAAPDFYQRPGDEIALATRQLQEMDASIEAAYERWEALETKRTAG